MPQVGYWAIWNQALSVMEDAMHNLVPLGQLLGDLGAFFLGCAAFWFVSVFEKKNK